MKLRTTKEVRAINKQADFKFRERRHPQWTENYELYRDTVITNRLTQRQSVNVPLMKEVIKTILSGVDDPPDNYYEELDNDKQKELYLNEYWKESFRELKIALLDIIDKKQVFLYGRSFMKLNVVGGKFFMEVIDPMDVLVDRYVNPWDLESARRITHLHIYRSIDEIAANPNYDKDAVNRLRTFFGTQAGLIKSSENAQAAQEKNERLADLGVVDINSPVLGSTIVELQETQFKEWDEHKKEWVVYVAVDAEQETLMEKSMREVLGVNFYTWTTWADDIERTDFWSDGVADIVRVPNQILNVMLSQMIENRTLRNFGMQYYDSTVSEGWTPSPVVPGPHSWFPLPGKPSDVLHKVEIPDLSDGMDEMKLVKEMVQSATASTKVETGEGEKGDATLGEIQLLASRAMKRITSMSKFYKQHWTEVGEKFAAIVNANALELAPVTLYKKSGAGNYFEKRLHPKEFQSRKGYKCRVTSKAEREASSLEGIQKMKIGVAEFPGNAPLGKIFKKKVLDWMDLSPEETREVLDFDDQQLQAAAQLPAGPTAPSPVDVALNEQSRALASVNGAA